ncbi:MAG: toll/interleukin-1 receptor domain-containing protein [Chloroflexi bacterium]|nr:toll/interleukin-1 receptor domain-containing protein [Chloroflexota bacterium]
MTILKRPISVFLIHTHRDREPVHELYARLAKDGIKPWLDSERLQPGQDWRHEINRAILTSDIAIVCLSRNFLRHQGYCQQEIKIALKKASLLPVGETFIIPARLEECDSPESLSRWQRVDLFEADGYKRLLRSLRAQVEVDKK